MTNVTLYVDKYHLYFEKLCYIIRYMKREDFFMVVKVEKLVKRYNDLIALDHFNLEVKEGEVFGLLGPNGSGKTTAINCILSLLKYDKGNIEVFDKPMAPDAYDIKRDIGIIMQNVAVFDELTVYENIDYFCGLYVTDKEKRKKLVKEAIDFVALNDFKKFYPKKLSGGLLRRLNIACGIAHKPKLIILDEPTVAVDPQSRNNILEGIQKLNAEGATIIYTSHYMEEVEQICSRIAIMDKGKIIATGTKDELKSMIEIGEKISVELFTKVEHILSDIQKIKGVTSVNYENDLLVIKSKRGYNNLTNILDYLKENKISYGRIYSELPTLNDVFLEITGKQLRD
ncbi:MAG: transport system ATP-binding protein [Clostridia bacterium]|nr:transport system ATP-binding protein [Clostridia bacterium]